MFEESANGTLQKKEFWSRPYLLKQIEERHGRAIAGSARACVDRLYTQLDTANPDEIIKYHGLEIPKSAMKTGIDEKSHHRQRELPKDIAEEILRLTVEKINKRAKSQIENKWQMQAGSAEPANNGLQPR